MIRRIAAEVEIFDLSHLIRPFGIREGAAVLAESVSWFPSAVHLAVVDPGVGSQRRALVLASGGALLVGPDNGLLLPAAERLGGVGGAWEITNPRLGLAGRSATFHGRDVFAPAAAHLALGVQPEGFGPPVDIRSLIRLPEPSAEKIPGGCRGEVVLTDRFGNLQTSLDKSHLTDPAPAPGDPIVVNLAGRTERAVLRLSYSLGAPGEIQVVEDSHGSLAVCVNRGSAAELFGNPPVGAPVSLTAGGGGIDAGRG